VTKRPRADGTPTLAPIEARQITEVFRAEAGLSFAEDAAFVLERRLRERLTALGIPTFAAYAELLRRGTPEAAREIEEALELVTTHETYFFREEYQLRAFRTEVLPRLCDLSGARRRISVWSAGCSTGEEPYSVAMILQSSPLLDGWEKRVLGSDLSKKCIAAARRGVYGKAAFRATPPEMRDAYFVEEADGTRVSADVRAMCTFAQLNLLHGDRCAVVGKVDAIFCRNVLIYLDAEARARVISTLFERLAPGGYLMLGHSESLLNVPSEFEPVSLTDALVYRRPDVGSGRLRTESR